MKNEGKVAASILTLFLVLIVPVSLIHGQEPVQKPAENPPRILPVTAKNFDFEPVVIHVKVGEKVQLKLTSIDRTHGIHIDPFPQGHQPNIPPGLSFTYGDECLKLKKDLTETLEFTAQAPGTYPFSCCKKCGLGHGRMKGKIVVEP